jgi:hypothetical protein
MVAHHQVKLGDQRNQIVLKVEGSFYYGVEDGNELFSNMTVIWVCITQLHQAIAVVVTAVHERE